MRVLEQPGSVVKRYTGWVATIGLLAVLFLFPGTADAAKGESELKPLLVETGFRMQGSHGFSIAVVAYAFGGENGGTVEIYVGRHRESVSYRASATVTADTLSADLGPLGRIEVVRRPSGRQRTVHPRCLGGSEAYEPGTYEGLIEFNGEEGYARARETSVPQMPAWLVLTSPSGRCSRGGYGETSGPGEPGARLRGVSFQGGRSLTFQVNKNGRRTKTVYEALLKERRRGIRILRALGGEAPSSAFRFDAPLRSAALSLPAPFSGSAALARSKDSFSPLWTGDLKLDFPGRSGLSLAGSDVHVSLVHARFTR